MTVTDSRAGAARVVFEATLARDASEEALDAGGGGSQGEQQAFASDLQAVLREYKERVRRLKACQRMGGLCGLG